MIQLAENSRFDRNIPHRGVIDAMLRQPHDATARPWQVHRLGAGPLTIRAADYDLGPAGVAYADTVDASYHVATGGERALWNHGSTYLNDGLDLARDADGRPPRHDLSPAEWRASTTPAPAAGRGP